MKIGIVTFVKCGNYGAEFQSYALQHVLNSMGYDAEVIDLEKREKDLATSLPSIRGAIFNRFKKLGIKAIAPILRLGIDVIKRKYILLRYKKEIKLRDKIFEDFFIEKIKHSERYYSFDDIRNEALELPYDVLIAGSDQIWNFLHTDDLDVYFLMFAQNKNIRKISYAASISIFEIPKEIRCRFKEYLKNLDNISVRELRGAEIITPLTPKKVEVVLDPTLLITKETWLSEMKPSKTFQNESYVLLYILTESKIIDEYAKDLALKNNYKVIKLKTNFSHDSNYNFINLYNVDPKDWIGLFAYAKYVVTDSFHGSCFSINFNVPFSIFINPFSMMNSRVLSILKITELEHRIIDINNVVQIPLILDFENANSIITQWREKSIKFLTSSISAQ